MIDGQGPKHRVVKSAESRQSKLVYYMTRVFKGEYFKIESKNQGFAPESFEYLNFVKYEMLKVLKSENFFGDSKMFMFFSSWMQLKIFKIG